MKDLENYAFIDSQNLNLSIRSLGWSIDWKKFRVHLKDKCKIEKAFLFIGYKPGNEKIYTFLQEAGYVIIFKPTLEQNGIIKGNCDAELVLHCMVELNNFDQAVIVTGDGDFRCLIEYLLEQNKLFKIGIPNKKKYSSLLRGFSNYFFFVSDLQNKLSYINKK
jgi:uncharacterized LabA/DUF88 family protein